MNQHEYAKLCINSYKPQMIPVNFLESRIRLNLLGEGRMLKIAPMGLPKGSRLLKRFARQQNPPKPKRRNSNPELPF